MEKMSFFERHENIHKMYRDSIFYMPIHSLYLVFAYIKFKIIAIYEYIITIPRALGFNEKKYQKLKEFKNKYKGKRCFITCTGPSLTISDLEMLKDEYVFGMNSIALIHDTTDWKPDFYGIQDRVVFENLKRNILSSDNGVVFAPKGFQKLFKTPDSWVYWPMCGNYHLFEMMYQKKYFTRFSDNAYVRVYDGYSITYSIMQLVVFMGFDEVYLLGADCSFLGNHQHFIETGLYEPENSDVTLKLFNSYGVFKKYAEKNNIKIFNATRGGCLELFQRVQLENVLAIHQKNKKYE